MSEPPAPRLAPLPRDRWDDEVRTALRHAFPEQVAERFLATGPDAMAVPNAIATMLHHPRLAGSWLAYNNVLLWSPVLDPRMRELMVLRVAWRTRSAYEWAQHVLLAARFGVTREDLDAVALGADANAWTPVERALIAATDQLLDHHRVDDGTWAVLAEHLDPRALVEMVFVVGTYTCLAMVFNSFGLELEPGVNTASIPPLPG